MVSPAQKTVISALNVSIRGLMRTPQWIVNSVGLRANSSDPMKRNGVQQFSRRMSLSSCAFGRAQTLKDNTEWRSRRLVGGTKTSFSTVAEGADRRFTLGTVTAEDCNRAMRIEWGDGHVSHFHMIWLRDHDHAATVGRSHTNQRETDTAFEVPLDISMKTFEVLPGGAQLRVEWSDIVEGVRESVFESHWLRSNCYQEHKASREAESKALHCWGSEMQSTVMEELSVPYSEMIDDDRGLLRLLQITQKFGVAIVSGTPHDKEISQRVTERVAPVRQTFYGGFWETVVLPPEHDMHIDSAYSTVELPAHTDGSYWVDPPGIQVFHCLKSDPTGGATLLVDGFKVAQVLRERDAAAFKFLCETPLPFQHRDDENHVVAMHTVFGMDEMGFVERFSMNALDRDTLFLPPDQVREFYKSWQALVQVVKDPALECWVKLEPGNLILINNQRVMHGRSAFTASSGRILVGCYISKEDWQSTKRVLESRL